MQIRWQGPRKQFFFISGPDIVGLPLKYPRDTISGPDIKKELRSWFRIANDINIQINKRMKQKRRAEKQPESS